MFDYNSIRQISRFLVMRFRRIEMFNQIWYN